jgi:hypothetical protein
VKTQKKFNLSEIAVVVFLAALIWVWAGLAQDERLVLTNAVSVQVARSVYPNLWVIFRTADPRPRATVLIDNVTLKGPASRKAEVERMRNRGGLDLNLFLVPEQWRFTEAGDYSLDMLSFLRQADAVQQLEMAVEDCEPRTLTVQAVELHVEDVAVVCVDSRGVSVAAQQIKPARVNVPVPPDDVGVARVRLTDAELERARQAPIEKRPYIELPDGKRRDALEMVTVSLAPPQETPLDKHNISATLGFCMSENLAGKYTVAVQNLQDMAIVQIKASRLAAQAYERQPFQLILPILDEDKPTEEPLERAALFNFPEEFVRLGEIEPDQSAPVVRFTLDRVQPAVSQASGL